MFSAQYTNREESTEDNGQILSKGATKFDTTFSDTVKLALGNSYSPEGLIEALKTHPKLCHLYEHDAGLLEKYTIEEHTLFVLHQFERYFASQCLPIISTSTFRLLLALHDIGKPLADSAVNQRDRTIEILDSIGALLPVSSGELELIKTLIQHDHFGGILKSSIAQSATPDDRLKMHACGDAGVLSSEKLSEFKQLSKLHDLAALLETKEFPEKIINATEWFVEKANTLQVTPERLFALALIYFQCDTIAYTSDAILPTGQRAKAGLEYLYDLHWGYGEDRPLKLYLHGKRIAGQSGFLFNARIWPHLVFEERAGAIISMLEARVLEAQSTLGGGFNQSVEAPKSIISSSGLKACRDLSAPPTPQMWMDVAQRAWEGEYGRGSLIIVDPDPSMKKPSRREKNDVIGAAGSESRLVRIVSLGSESSRAGAAMQRGYVGLQGGYELYETNRFGPIGAVVLPRSEEGITTMLNAWRFHRSGGFDCAVVKPMTPSVDELRSLLSRGLQHCTLGTIIRLTESSVSKIDSLLEPGFSCRSDAQFIGRERLQFTKLPTEEWIVQKPVLVRDWKTLKPKNEAEAYVQNMRLENDDDSGRYDYRYEPVGKLPSLNACQILSKTPELLTRSNEIELAPLQSSDAAWATWFRERTAG